MKILSLSSDLCLIIWKNSKNLLVKLLKYSSQKLIKTIKIF